MRTVKSFAAALAVALVTPAWAVGGMAELSVFYRSEDRLLPLHWHDGRAWVVGKPGNEYQVVLRYRPQARFATWLYTIAHHRLVDHWRRHELRTLSLDDEEAAKSRLRYAYSRLKAALGDV